MLYAFISQDVENSLEKRLSVREQHVARLVALKDEGRLLEDKAWAKCTLFDILFEPKQFSISDLRVGFRNLVKKLYSKEFTDYRRQSFKEKLKAVSSS